MPSQPDNDTAESPLTLRKAVTTLAIAPQNEPLTRTARLAYNLMIFLSQNMRPDEDGGYSAPMSEVINGYGGTTRDSKRVQRYVEQMCTTIVRWFPLSRSDEENLQTQIVGLDEPPDSAEFRVFTLLSEARFTRRAGEQWMTWYFPPTIRETVIYPSRWAQVDIQEMSQLSHYASLALFEICSRYKDVPGGLTNRADVAFWVRTLRADPEEKTKLREWTKFKNERLKPALAEINMKTSLTVELIEGKRGRAIVDAQFAVRRKAPVRTVAPIDLSLVELAGGLGIREREIDLLVETHGEQKVKQAVDAMVVRNRSMAGTPIRTALRYLQKILRNGTLDSPLLDDPEAGEGDPPRAQPRSLGHLERERRDQWMADRREQLNAALANLTEAELAEYALRARMTLSEKGLLTPHIQKRFDQKQYDSPMVREYIRAAFAESTYGPNWKEGPPAAAPREAA